jgi:Asp-tRNAAsn/Glu-tRNAGln amidotransferase B subunit (PET112 homolog)
VRARLPELPKQKRARFVQQYDVTPYDAGVLADDLELAAYFEKAARDSKKPKAIANWILNDLQSALSTAGKPITDCPIPAAGLERTGRADRFRKVSSKQGKEVFAEMFATGKSADRLFGRKESSNLAT